MTTKEAGRVMQRVSAVYALLEVFRCSEIREAERIEIAAGRLPPIGEEGDSALCKQLSTIYGVVRDIEWLTSRFGPGAGE